MQPLLSTSKDLATHDLSSAVKAKSQWSQHWLLLRDGNYRHTKTASSCTANPWEFPALPAAKKGLLSFSDNTAAASEELNRLATITEKFLMLDIPTL